MKQIFMTLILAENSKGEFYTKEDTWTRHIWEAREYSKELAELVRNQTPMPLVVAEPGVDWKYKFWKVQYQETDI